MAFEYLAYSVLEQPNYSDVIVDRRALRDVENPFDLNVKDFQKLYRLTPVLVEDLVYELDGMLKGSRVTAISSEKQVLAALRFYATGCYQRPVAEQWGISMGQSSLSRCLHRVTNAINDAMFCAKVKFPMTQIERQAAKAIFAAASSPFVAGTIGAVDCTHVSILAPTIHEESYVNHHGYHSINVQMICDPNLKILNVNAKYPGARHDSYVWSSSAVRRVMQRNFENGNSNMFLIGDSGYPLEPWLMTPLTNHPEGSPKFRYNESLCKARNIIERLFGVLKGTWRCLSKQRSLLYEPGFVGKIVNACTVLHNINVSQRISVSDDAFTEPATSNNLVMQYEPSSAAKRVQERLVSNFFT